MQFQRRFQIARVNNISSVFELSGVTFRLAPHYGGLLVIHDTNESASEQQQQQQLLR